MPAIMNARTNEIHRLHLNFSARPDCTAKLTRAQYSKLLAETTNGLIPVGSENRKLATRKAEGGLLEVFTEKWEG